MTVPQSFASNEKLDDLEKDFSPIRPSCFLTVEHGNNVFIENEALDNFLMSFSPAYKNADTSANLQRLRGQRKTLEKNENPELQLFTFIGEDSAERHKVLELARDLATGTETPYTRGEEPEYAFALLAWYFHEWEHIQKSSDAIRAKIIDLQAEKRDNQAILDHIHENGTYFPQAWDNTALAMLDYLTSKNAESNENSTLARGVVLIQKYLDGENQKLAKEISELSEEQLHLVHRVQRVSYKLNNPRLRAMIEGAMKLLQSIMDRMPAQLKKPQEESNQLFSKMLDIYRDKREKLSKSQVEAVKNILKSRSKLADPNIRTELDACVKLSIEANSQALNQLLKEVQPINCLVLDFWHELHKAQRLYKFLNELPTKEQLNEKVLGLFYAGQSLTIDRSELELREALDTLKHGFDKELPQIANDLIENHAKGFFWENFVRWLLVTRTEGMLPPMVKAAVESLEAKLVKPIDPNPIEEPRPSLHPDRSPDYAFAVRQVSTIHFPPKAELQRNRGRVADALICAIQNMPDELFKEMVEQRVVARLDHFNRAEWVKNIATYVARFGAEKLVKVIKSSLIDMIKKNSGDPALLALSNTKIDELLAIRVAAGVDQSAIVQEIQQMRENMVPTLQIELANLAMLEKEAPGRVSQLVNSAKMGFVACIESLVPACPEAFEYPNSDDYGPIRQLTWDEQMQHQLSQARNDFITHIKQLDELRRKMRGTSRPVSPKGK